MRCENCGFVSSTDFVFCTNCGAPAPQAIDETVYSATPKTLKSVKSGMFMAICILFTAASVLSLNIVNLICTIVLWIIYANGRKNELNATHFKVLSGCTIAAQILYVLNALGALGTPLILLGYGSLIGVMAPIGVASEGAEGAEVAGAAFGGTIIFGIILFMALPSLIQVILYIVNCTCMSPIHKFAKSVHLGIENEIEDVYEPKKVSSRIITIGIITIILAFSALATYLNPYSMVMLVLLFVPVAASFISSILISIALFLASSLIKKNFAIEE